MLVKKLCRDCWKRKQWIEKLKEFEEVWSKPCVAILCPAVRKEGIKGKQHVYLNDDPPLGCPYYLEHMVSNYGKENMNGTKKRRHVQS